jgi:hypothetical protein
MAAFSAPSALAATALYVAGSFFFSFEWPALLAFAVARRPGRETTIAGVLTTAANVGTSPAVFVVGAAAGLGVSLRAALVPVAGLFVVFGLAAGVMMLVGVPKGGE